MYEALAPSAIALGVLLFILQSFAMFQLASKRMKLGLWMRLALIWRTLSFLLAGGGLLLSKLGPEEAGVLAENLLVVGLINLVVAVFQGVRVRSAIRVAMAKRDAEE